MSPQIPTLLEMLQAGVHFGHRVSKWYPKMEQYIFAERKGVHIINLELTQKKLEEALNFVRDLAKRKGVLIFVGTKKQATELVKNAAISCGMPYVNGRWLGGTLTNFSVIFKLIQKYKNLKKKKELGELEKYTKKEQLEFDREIERLEKIVGGISSLEKLPDALFIIDLKHEKTAVNEAQKMHVPLVALCDSNVNPEFAAYPIPANDDATKSLLMMVNLVSEAVKEGKLAAAEAEVRPQEQGKEAQGTEEIKVSKELSESSVEKKEEAHSSAEDKQ